MLMQVSKKFLDVYNGEYIYIKLPASAVVTEAR